MNELPWLLTWSCITWPGLTSNHYLLPQQSQSVSPGPTSLISFPLLHLLSFCTFQGLFTSRNELSPNLRSANSFASLMSSLKSCSSDKPSLTTLHNTGSLHLAHNMAFCLFPSYQSCSLPFIFYSPLPFFSSRMELS